jgi:Amt family ammonium transporter
VGLIASTIVWFGWTYIMPMTMRRVDDAMGVLYTHGLAGLCGGLLVGIFADPSIIVYTSSSGNPVTVKGWLYGNRHQFFIQVFAALTIIVYDALMTFLILKVISIFTKLRMPDDELEGGDVAVHEEEAYPADEGYTRLEPSSGGVLVGAAPGPEGASSSPVSTANLQAGDS